MTTLIEGNMSDFLSSIFVSLLIYTSIFLILFPLIWPGINFNLKCCVHSAACWHFSSCRHCQELTKKVACRDTVADGDQHSSYCCQKTCWCSCILCRIFNFSFIASHLTKVEYWASSSFRYMVWEVQSYEDKSYMFVPLSFLFHHASCIMFIFEFALGARSDENSVNEQKW